MYNPVKYGILILMVFFTGQTYASKQLSAFPQDATDASDVSEIKQQMITALLNSATIKDASEVINIAVTSNWHEGVYTDSKLPYRKIIGTILFADKDNDGVSRFTSYSFISNQSGGAWSALKFRAFTGNPEGWAKPEKGLKGSSGGFMWILLALVNIVAGLVASKELLKSKLTAIEKITRPLEPFSVIIGLASLVLGLSGFVLAILSLNILSGITPQLTAVVLGLVLGREYLNKKATGKLKQQLDEQQQNLQKISDKTQLIGIVGLVVGILHLVLGGSLHVI